MYAITYTDDVRVLQARCLELCDEGSFKTLVQRVSLDEDADGVLDGIKLLMTKVDTAYSTTSYASLCLINLDEYDIIGEDSFCTQVGLTVLAYGTDTYWQIEANAAKRAIYETVIPSVDGVFQHWIEIDSSVLGRC